MIAAGTVIIIACIVFSVPFIVVPSYSVETYNDTEIKQEQYTVPEPYTQLEKREYEEIIFQG